MADNGVVQRDFFISRAGENADTAIQIAEILRAAGYTTFIQDQDFGNADFMARMADGFAMVDRGARVIALLSPYYQKKPHCMKEAHYPLTDDPNNKRERLIVLRIADCTPEGHLRGIPYVDLVPLLLNADGFARAVRGAIAPHGQAEVVRTPGAQILHPEIRPVLGFTGRKVELEAVEAALWSKGGKAALTNTGASSAAVKGLGGVGKSVLAQEYAWRNRARYHGVWWIRAEKSETLLDDLVELGARFIPGLKEVKDRAQAAHAALDAIAHMRAEKPWLLVYDNVEQPGDVDKLTPVDGAHVLITTRWSDWGKSASPVKIGVFPPDVAAQFLLDSTERTDRAGAEKLAAALGFLPLALDHAAVYCRRTDMAFDKYRELAADLIRKVPKGADYEDEKPVFATFELAIQRATEACPEAEKLMGICAFLAPERIPLDIITTDVMSEIERGEAVAALQEVSLVTLEALDDGSAGVSLHRLVQEVMRGRLKELGEYGDVAAMATKLIADVFPFGEIGPADVRSWPVCARLLPHALAVLDRAPEEGERTRFLLNQLATFLATRGAHGVAERLYRRVLAIREKILGADHLSTATTIDNLAVLLSAMGRHREAEPFYRRALATREKLEGNNPAISTSLNNLATLLLDLQRLDEAEPLLRRALAIDEATLGPDHIDVANDLNNLAILLGDTNRHQDAELLHRRALGISEKALGPEHPKVAMSLNNLARLYLMQGSYDEAEPLVRRALTIHERALGPEHPEVAMILTNLAEVHRNQCHYEEAELLYLRALAICEHALGPDHPNVALSLNNMATLQLAQGHYGKAEPLYLRALAIHENALGPDHPNVALSLWNLAELHRNQRHSEAAEPFYRRALAVFDSSLGPHHPRTRAVRESLAALGAELHRDTVSEAPGSNDPVPAAQAHPPAQAEKPGLLRRLFGGGA